MKKLGHLIVGIALGGFLGLVIGLSSAPTVVSVATFLIGVSAALFGLRQQVAGAGFGTEMLFLLAGFSAAGVGGLLFGLDVRVSNRFSDGPKEIVAEWQSAGYSEEQALAIGAYLGAGVVFDGEGNLDVRDVPDGYKRVPSSLMNTDDDTYAALSPSLYGSFAEVSEAYRKEGGLWAAMADVAESSGGEESDKVKLMGQFWKLGAHLPGEESE